MVCTDPNTFRATAEIGPASQKCARTKNGALTIVNISAVEQVGYLVTSSTRVRHTDTLPARKPMKIGLLNGRSRKMEHYAPTA